MVATTAKCIDNSNFPKLILNETYDVYVKDTHVEIIFQDGLHYYPINIFDCVVKQEIDVSEYNILVMGDKKFSYNEKDNIWCEI